MYLISAKYIYLGFGTGYTEIQQYDYTFLIGLQNCSMSELNYPTRYFHCAYITT